MDNQITLSKEYPLNILIAESNHDSRLSAKDILIQLGYRPEIATTGQELLKMTSSNSYDVVLMDIRMPEAEGLLTSQRTDTTDTGCRRPILIAMTPSRPAMPATGQADFREMYLQEGMDHSISKPVDPAELTLQLMACSLLTGTRRILPNDAA
jgi:CheY-like chemotaxis protein